MTMNNTIRVGALALTVLMGGFAADATARQPAGVAAARGVSAWSLPRRIEPIVTTEWLFDNLEDPELVVLDIRPAEAYEEDHIISAINEPFDPFDSAWAVVREGSILELPDEDELFAAIGELGISANSLVVVVSAPNPGEPVAYGWANATRVADTLLYAGLRHVAILDGGYVKWLEEGLPTTDAVPVVEPTDYSGWTRRNMFVSKEYVESRIGRAILIDTRDADVYFGATIEPFADKPGHIATGRSLPTPWLWATNGTFREHQTLAAMAEGVAGVHRRREIIVYCGVGGYTSSWWFVLSQVLGYKNVKFYDGSAQDWVTTNDMVPYRWE